MLRRALLRVVRVASFVPTGTEWMYALGLEEKLVGVTFECGERATRERSILVRSPLAAFEGASAATIDTEVRTRVARGEPLYVLDEEALREARPDVILAQSLCDVCAASHAQLARAKEVLGYAPRVVEVAPARLAEAPEDAVAIARAADAPGAGDALAARLRARLKEVHEAVASGPRPRVAILEWTDPPMRAGHWIPDLAEAAGAHEVLGVAGTKSEVVGWDALREAAPHAILVAPCGLDLAASRREAERVAREFPRAEVHAFDARRYFSRSGPSLVGAVELLAHALHPDLWPEPAHAGGAWARMARKN